MTEERTESRIFQQLAGELVAGGLGFRFVAKGRSMLPTIQDGEILQVRPVNKAKLKVGDIVLFKEGAELKAHRIVRKRRELFITRGDASMEADGEIRREQIVGKVGAKECGETGRLISLDGRGARARFLARRWVSRSVGSLTPKKDRPGQNGSAEG